MNTFQKFLILLGVSALVAVGNAGNPDAFSVFTGELITIEPEVAVETDATEAAAIETPTFEPVDLSNAVLTISYDTTNEEGEVVTETLYEGPYGGDFIHVHKDNNNQPLHFPTNTEITISLQVSEESDPMTLNTAIKTGLDVDFAYLDRPGPWDSLVLVGTTNQVVNPENRFTVSGDLSFLGSDIAKSTTVSINTTYFDDEGQSQFKEWGPVLLTEGSFSIEGEVAQPSMAYMYINDMNEYYTSAQMILEPQSELEVSQLGDQIQQLSVASGSGYHSMVVESWQQDKKYIALIEAYAAEFDRYRERRESGEAEPESEASDDESYEVAANESAADDSSESEDIVETLTPEEGCEDAVAQESEIGDSSFPTPKYYELQQVAEAFRNEKLIEIAEGDGDPMARYLAVGFSPYGYFDPRSELAVMQSLVEEFDEQFVESYLKPGMEQQERMAMLVENDAALVPGQKVPEFSLADYDGEDRSLYSLLAENDMVLIDFWASWCGPCIADFPELKKLHAAYTDEDFEIIGVSIDSTDEDWIGGVDEHELPWINLGEIKGWEGPVSTMYGVVGIPKGFLVDAQGCIYKKNIRPAALKEFLVDRYGMDESLEEPDIETEDTQEVSS